MSAVTGVTLAATIGSSAYAIWLMVRMFRYSVDVPFFDQWWFARFLRDTDRDGLSLQALWTPHNEHRVFVPRLVLYGLARLTGWNVRAEMALIQLLLVSRFALIAVVVWVIGRRISDRESAPHARYVWLSLPVIAATLCTRAQAENLLWGWQVTLTLGALLTTVCCLLMTSKRNSLFVAAIICALMAQFSFASAVVLWPVGAVAILLRGSESRRVRAIKLFVWLAIGTTATVLANHNTYRIPATHPVTAARIIRYSVMFLGGPFAGTDANAESNALRLGWIGIAVFIASVLGVGLTRQLTRWMPVILWGLTAPLSAIVTAYGRVGMVPSLGQALSSRYVTVSAVMWASTAVLIVATILGLLPNDPASATKPRAFAARLIVGMVCTVLSVNLVQQGAAWEAWGNGTRAGNLRNRAILANEQLLTDAEKLRLFPAPGWIDELRPFLVEKHYTLFRHQQKNGPQQNGGTK